MIVGPIQAQMDDFCDLHGTPDTPVSRIVTVKGVIYFYATYLPMNYSPNSLITIFLASYITRQVIFFIGAVIDIFCSRVKGPFYGLVYDCPNEKYLLVCNFLTKKIFAD